MSAAAVFKCIDNEPLNQYAVQRDRAEALWRAKFDAYKAALGVDSLHGTQFYDGGWSIHGYVIPQGEQPQHGWRRDRDTQHAVPAKRTEDGKALARELSSLYLPGNKYPGVPDLLHSTKVNGQGYLIFPRTELLGDQWWLALSKHPEQPTLIDPALWAPAKLSEYYSAKEEAEAQS